LSRSVSQTEKDYPNPRSCFCVRINEILSFAYPSDLAETTPHGKYLTVSLADYQPNFNDSRQLQTVWFNMLREGRQNLTRSIEPWTQDLYSYIKQKRETHEQLFPWPRQKVLAWAHDAFQGWHYQIEAYNCKGRITPAHFKRFARAVSPLE
jgi:hypothetical protein